MFLILLIGSCRSIQKLNVILNLSNNEWSVVLFRYAQTFTLLVYFFNRYLGSIYVFKFQLSHFLEHIHKLLLLLGFILLLPLLNHLFNLVVSLGQLVINESLIRRSYRPRGYIHLRLNSKSLFIHESTSRVNRIKAFILIDYDTGRTSMFNNDGMSSVD